ncbi:hypothetical protein CYMTET_50596, partial [Cymbomonas tetramitiformis]
MLPSIDSESPLAAVASSIPVSAKSDPLSLRTSTPPSLKFKSDYEAPKWMVSNSLENLTGSRQLSADVPLQLPKLPGGKSSRARFVVDPKEACFAGKPGVAGVSYRFYLPTDIFKKVPQKEQHLSSGPELRHLDVYCDWDQGQEALDTHALSSTTRFSRLTYSFSLFKHENQLPSDTLMGWEAFRNCAHVDVHEFTSWLTKLVPRSVHDFKPLMCIMKAALTTITAKELEWFSKLMKELEDKLAKERLKNAELTLRLQEMESEWDAKVKQLLEDVKAGKDASLAALSNAQMQKLRLKRQTTLKASMEEMLKDALDQVKGLFAECNELRNQLADKERETADLQRQLDEALMSLAKEEKARKALEAENEDLKKKLKQKQAQLDEREGHLGEQSTALDKQKELDVAMMPWATFRHIVECTWAAQLTTGLHTISVPPATKVVISGRKVFDGHLINVPGTTSIYVPDEADVTVPSSSCFIFPEETGEVTLPAGTSITLPKGNNTNASKFTLTIPPHTRVVPPLESSGIAADNLECVSQDSVHFAPTGGMSDATCIAGSIIIMPKKGRAKIKIPTNSELIFAFGQKRHVEVPAGTTIETPSGADHPCLVPPSAEIQLPAQSLLHQGYTNQTVQSKHESEREMYLLLTPGAEVILPKKGESYKITMPSGSRVKAPQDSKPTPDIGPGCSYTRENGLPFSCNCPEGSTIRLPSGTNASPEAVAKRFILSGTDCCSMAIGGMDPNFAAQVINTGIVDPRRVSLILHNTREVAAYAILRRMDKGLIKQVMDLLPATVAGVIISQTTGKEQDDMMGKAGVVGNKRVLISAHAANYMSVKTLLSNKEFRPWKTTEEIGSFDPLSIARLLASAPSSRAAAIMSNMSSTNFGKAVETMNNLNDIASKALALTHTYKREDIELNRLFEQLCTTNTTMGLRKKTKEVLTFCNKEYGIAMTLSNARPQEVEKEELSPEEEFGITSKEQEEKSVMLTMLKESMTSAAAKEEMADERLNIIMSTEDIKFGTNPNPADDPDQECMTTALKSSQLIKVQEKAAAVKDLCIHQTIMMIPVLSIDGSTCVCFLSHVLKRNANTLLLGGFPRPAENLTAKAVEVMTQLAKALRQAYDEVARNPNRDEIVLDQNEWTRLQEMLENLKMKKKQAVDDLMMRRKKIMAALQEMKGYDKPPVIVVRVFSALFVVLNIGDYEEYLKEKLTSFPKDPFANMKGGAVSKEKDATSLWLCLRSNIHMSHRHPDNLLKVLHQTSREDLTESDPDSLQEKLRRATASKKLTEPVEMKALERASGVAVMLMEFLNISVQQ